MSEGAPERRRKRLGPWRIGLLAVAALLLLAVGLLVVKVTTTPAPFPIPPVLALDYPEDKFDSPDNALHRYEEVGEVLRQAQDAALSGGPTSAQGDWQRRTPSQWSEADVERARRWVHEFDAGLQKLREAVAQPYFVARSGSGEEMPPYQWAVRMLAHTAVYKAGLALRDGDEAAAVDALITPLHAAAHLTQSGPLLLRATARAVEFIALHAIWDAVSSGSVRDRQSQQQLADGLEFLETHRGPLANALRAEYRQTHDDIERWARNGPRGVRDAMELSGSSQGQDDASRRLETLQFWAELRVFHPRALQRVTAHYQEKVRVLETDPLQALRNEMAERRSSHAQDVLSDLVLFRWQAIEAEATSDAQRRAIAIGIAAARYRLDHGEFPPALAAMVPKYLKAIPLDPYDWQPMKVRREPDRFVIWSIGADFTDQGGRIALQMRDYMSGKPGDLVWRLEATPVKEGKR